MTLGSLARICHAFWGLASSLPDRLSPAVRGPRSRAGILRPAASVFDTCQRKTNLRKPVIAPAGIAAFAEIDDNVATVRLGSPWKRAFVIAMRLRVDGVDARGARLMTAL